jgi:hypothetical protein
VKLKATKLNKLGSSSPPDQLASFPVLFKLLTKAGMVELVDTRDLGSRALGRAGSTPVSGTFPNDNEERNRYGRIKRKSLRIKLYS